MIEIKAVIDGVEYAQNQIASCHVSKGLFSGSTLSIGGCVSAEMEIVLIEPGEIPRGADVKLYARENGGDWIPQGIYFIDTRPKSENLNTVTLSCFDAMLATEQVWLTSDYAGKNWPMPQSDAVADIAARIGVEVDSRTTLSTSFPVEYPVDEYGDITMREVLSYIASSNGGNWIITNEGKLLLVRLSDIPPETNYLIDEKGNAILFGEVRLLV